MPANIVMPKMGYDMTGGKIVRWLKHEGDPVSRGEPVAVIETEKVNIEIESFVEGTIARLLAKEGDTVPVGQPIAEVLAPGERPTVPAAPPPVARPEEVRPAAPPAAVPAPPPPPVAMEERIKASPLARRLAEEHGIDLSQVRGTGPGGRITREDVEAVIRAREARPAPPAAPPAPPAVVPGAPPYEEVPISRMRQAIGHHMVESKTTAPHFYVTMEINMGEALRLRESLNQALDEQSRVSINDMVLKAAAMALRKFPDLNASFVDQRIRMYKRVDMAVAVAVPDGLVTPVVQECDTKSLVQIARETKELAARAREGRLRQHEYVGGTFTVSNLGMFGVEEFIAIINPPQTAILAVGAIRRHPIFVDDRLVPADIMKVTVSADHRVTDGARVAQFLQELRRILETPALLLLAS